MRASRLLVIIFDIFLAQTALSEPFAYVANEDTVQLGPLIHTVSVIDLSNHTVVATIDMPGIPHAITASPDGATVYVANYVANTDGLLSVIDTASNVVTQTAAVSRTSDIASHPDGSKLYIGSNNYNDNKILSIDASTYRILASLRLPNDIPDGGGTIAIEAHSNGEHIYVLSHALFGAVRVIDITSNTLTLTHSIDGVGEPWDLVVHPDGYTVYVTDQESDRVSVISTTTNQVEDTVATGRMPRGIAIHPEGGRIYIANWNHGKNSTVWITDTSTRSRIASVAVGNGPFDVAVHPDGSAAYVTNEFSNSVSVIDTITNSVVDTISVGYGPTVITIASPGNTSQPPDTLLPVDIINIINTLIFDD